MVGVVGGNNMVVADVNDVLLYLPRHYVKSVHTDRNSGNHTPGTVANDPDLAGIPLEVGEFEIEILGWFTLATTTTQKIITRWGFTGTWNTGAIRGVVGPGLGNTANPDNVTLVNVRGYTTATQDAGYDTSTTTAYSHFREICTDVQVTVAGNFSFQWAQAASSANNTTLRVPTTVKITRKRV